jgi:hypothetical protein
MAQPECWPAELKLGAAECWPAEPKLGEAERRLAVRQGFEPWIQLLGRITV